MQPRRRSATRFKQFVADRVPERVVDALELVDIDVEHRHLFAAMNPVQSLFELLAKQRPVRQVGQDVVMREMRDPRVGLPAFGDVLLGRHPSATGERLVDDLDRTAVCGLYDGMRNFSLRDVA
jgi:hypothetical protein